MAERHEITATPQSPDVSTGDHANSVPPPQSRAANKRPRAKSGQPAAIGSARRKSAKPAAASASAAKKSSGAAGTKPETRVRFSGDLPRPISGDVPYAKSRPELAGYSEAQITRDILDSAAWDEVMRPVLALLDRARARPGKVQPLYTSEELETVMLYGRVCGLRTCREIRNRLAGDRGEEARRLLGFDRPRPVPGKKVVRLRSGIPSESTLSRHCGERGRFVEHHRMLAYLELEQRLLDEHLETPELRDEALVLDMDGTTINTHYSTHIYDSKTKQLVNGGLSERGFPKITAPEAGYVSKSDAPTDHSGHGWNLISVTTQTGVPLAWRLVPLNQSEKATGHEIVRDELAQVVNRLGHRRLRVLTTDGAFTHPETRAACRELGIVENSQLASKSDVQVPQTKAKVSLTNAEKRNKARIPIDGSPNWHTNGHRELMCRCGHGRVVKRIKLGDRGKALGKAIVRAEGQCSNCGSLTITSGDWRLAQNPAHWRRKSRFDPNGVTGPDLLMGNPLTFNDPVANEYGRRRFGHNEGFHGALASRFGLTEGKRWFRRTDQVRVEVAMTFCVMHAIALEQRRRVRAATSGAQAQAPPLAA